MQNRDKKGTLTVAKLNVVENTETAELYKVEGVPATVFFKEAKEIKRFNGFKYEEDVEKEIKEVIEDI